MQNDFNKEPFDEKDERNKEQAPKQEEQNRQEQTPRWTPYTERYQTVSKTERPKKRWVIPLIIALVIMVAAITVGGVFGARRLSAMVKDGAAITDSIAPPETTNNDPAVISTTDTSGLGSSTLSGSIILTDVSDIVEEVIPAVVSITSRSMIDTGGYRDYWNFFFGGSYGGYDEGGSQEIDSGIGSGTIISENSTELLILTSYHVVEGSSSLYVTFNDGASVDGYIKSQSEADDIAIVAVPLSDISEDTISSIKIARLSTTPAAVGDGAIVIGNALGYGMSVTCGIISATDRQISVDGKTLTVMQTDAAINSGNSGGCVLNSNGDIIGISEAKISSSMVEGMCYAIPVSSNTELIKTLLNQTGSTNNATTNQGIGQGAYLGIRGRDVDSTLANSYGKPQGVYVAGVIAGGGAEEAGLKEGDIIVGMDNVSFTTMNELQEQLSRHEPGDKVTLIVMREKDGKYSQMKLEAVLTEPIS